MPAQSLWEPCELSKGDAGAMGRWRSQPRPPQQKEELWLQRCRVGEPPCLGSLPLSPVSTRFTCQFCHCTCPEISRIWPKSRQGRCAWSLARDRKQRTEAETPTNCIAETSNPKRRIFSQGTVTHDLIFLGLKISMWFIWSEKENSPTVFHLGVMFISYLFYQFPVTTIKSNSRWYSYSTKTLKLSFL